VPKPASEELLRGQGEQEGSPTAANVLAGHCEQEGAEADPLMMLPATQVHDDEPAREWELTGQGVQTDEALAEA